MSLRVFHQFVRNLPTAPRLSIALQKHKRRQSRASGSGAPRSVVMCYSARADPEAVRGISRPVRGIKRDTFVHLKETYDPLNKMSAEKARRCHARVLKTEKRGLPGFKKSYARLTDCSPEMLEVMERKANAYDGDEEMNRPTDLVEGGWNKVLATSRMATNHHSSPAPPAFLPHCHYRCAVA